MPLHYLFEPRQGKSNALNTGINRARARVIVFTDDDVEIPKGWLDAAVRPLLERSDIDYTGGPVRPGWRAPRPRWLDETGNLGGTIAVKDHGTQSFVFEDQRKTPLGVNMAVRRSLDRDESVGSDRIWGATDARCSARSRPSSSIALDAPARAGSTCRRCG